MPSSSTAEFSHGSTPSPSTAADTPIGLALKLTEC
jgi:hypothetical protein